MNSKFLCHSIDDYLGDSKTRFFGMGYRRVVYNIKNIDIQFNHSGDNYPKLISLLSVEYPLDWSKKKNTNLPPHLSSIDTLILSTQFCEIFLKHSFQFDSFNCKKMWLKSLKLKSGTTPQEDLDNISAKITWNSTSKLKSNDVTMISIFDCQIGKMEARCEIEHPVAEIICKNGFYRSPADILEPSNSRYYGDIFKFRGQSLQNISYDSENHIASAKVKLNIPEFYHSVNGIDGHYQPSATYVDCFVVNLQLAQVLMYELDHINRKDSETLWMLRTEIEAPTPTRNFQSNYDATTRITSTYKLKVRGEYWRYVDIEGNFSGIKIKCSLGHKLPTSSDI
ncbi:MULTISPECIES: AvrD family protein [Xenorhabdus]|uniref:AvrD family protein n=1 Tax=Xenorhabdus TaxID=626 RepID=UPI00064777CC|nr:MULTISPECIES: AvrD family protein [Xenorhabdus]MBC8944202.1 syringolide biosynthetic protein AvrD1 [Xenorhabdus indica]